MLEGSIEMRLFSQLYNLGKVLVVYVGVDPEETLQNCFGNA